MKAAVRSDAECAASEMMLIEPERRPTISLKTTRSELETMDTAAARVLDRSVWLRPRPSDGRYSR